MVGPIKLEDSTMLGHLGPVVVMLILVLGFGWVAYQIDERNIQKRVETKCVRY